MLGHPSQAVLRRRASKFLASSHGVSENVRCLRTVAPQIKFGRVRAGGWTGSSSASSSKRRPQRLKACFARQVPSYPSYPPLPVPLLSTLCRENFFSVVWFFLHRLVLFPISFPGRINLPLLSTFFFPTGFLVFFCF